jgi:PAS domain S-box-containing protein
MRLRLKLLLPFLLLPIGSILVLGVMAYANGRSSLEASLGRLFAMGAARELSSLDRELTGLFRGAEAWTALESMQDVATGDLDGRLSSFLVARAREQPSLRRAVVADRTGRVVAASHVEWLGGTLASAEAAGSGCRDDAKAPPGTVACSFPIRAHFDESHRLGTLEVAWNLAGVFGQLRHDEHAGPVPPGVVLLRRDGRVVAASAEHSEWLGLSLAEAGSRAAARAGRGEGGYLVEALAGEPHLVGYAHSQGPSGWSTLVVQRTDVAFAPVGRLRGAVLGVGAGVAAVAVVLSLLLSTTLTRAVRELETAARRVSTGDLSVRVTPRSADEIGSLARSFDSMVRELERQRAQLVDRQYLDSMISGMSDGVFVVDADGRIERANPALLAWTGQSTEATLGTAAGEIFVEGEPAFAERVLHPGRRDGAATEVELHVRSAGGGALPVIVSAGRLPGSAPRPALVCIATDISRRAQAEAELKRAREAAEAAAAAKSQFLAVLSHEVRTPLNGVIGTTDLLAGTSLSEKQREYVETARRSGEALLALLGDILDYSRMEAGRLGLARSAFDLRECVFGAADLLAAGAHGKGVELTVRVDDGVPQRVVGDPQRLRQVLLNLVGNAVKFTEAGSVAVDVTRATGSPARLTFSVADSGVGIPAEEQARVFEPFHQVDASSTRRHGGVGLGLAITRQLVTLMGGSIQVQSHPGEGSTFTFTAELPPVLEDRPRPAVDPASLSGRRVLVVDDNATNRYVLREMLSAWGCVTEEAADGWEGLARLRAAAEGARSYDLALVDFQMPEMDGMALARQVGSDPRIAGVPLVLLTSIPQHAETGGIGGFAACLAKPIRQAVLLETLVAVVSRRETGTRDNVTRFRRRE